MLSKFKDIQELIKKYELGNSNNITLLSYFNLTNKVTQKSATVLNQQQKNAANDPGFTLKQQQKLFYKQRLALTAFILEQDQILESSLSNMLKQQRTTIHQQYKWLAVERKRYAAYIVKIVEEVLQTAEQKKLTKARYKLTNLDLKLKRKRFKLNKANAWLYDKPEKTAASTNKFECSIWDNCNYFTSKSKNNLRPSI